MSESSNSLDLDTSPSQTTEETASIVSPTKVKKSARFSVQPTNNDGDSRKNFQHQNPCERPNLSATGALYASSQPGFRTF